jgi:phage terminase small subunit
MFMNAQTQEALKMAIEEIEGWIDHAYGHSPDECANNEAIKACKEALEQPAQEPKSVGFIRDLISIDKDGIETYKVTPVYTHPHQWQGLTDDEIENILHKHYPDEWEDFAHAIEQALKEKNHG